MPSTVMSYEQIVNIIRALNPDVRAQLALQRALIRDGRVVVNDESGLGVEYRLTEMRRLAAHEEV